MKRKPNRIRTSPVGPSFRKGFTLIELLISITIILVLAALTMVVTGKLRASAYRANAMSSLRQVAAMNVAYSTENLGDINTMRYVGDPKEGGGGAWVKNSFWGRLQPYLFPDVSETNQNRLKKELNARLDQLFSTPDADTMVNTVLNGSRIYHDGSGLPVPYAFNKNLNKWGEFLKVSSFSDPSQVLYAVYGFGLFDEADGKAYVERPTDNSKPENNIYYLDDRKAIAAFLDGHIESVTAPIPDRRFK